MGNASFQSREENADIVKKKIEAILKEVCRQ